MFSSCNTRIELRRGKQLTYDHNRRMMTGQLELTAFQADKNHMPLDQYVLASDQVCKNRIQSCQQLVAACQLHKVCIEVCPKLHSHVLEGKEHRNLGLRVIGKFLVGNQNSECFRLNWRKFPIQNKQ